MQEIGARNEKWSDAFRVRVTFLIIFPPPFSLPLIPCWISKARKKRPFLSTLQIHIFLSIKSFFRYFNSRLSIYTPTISINTPTISINTPTNSINTPSIRISIHIPIVINLTFLTTHQDQPPRPAEAIHRIIPKKN